MFVPGGAAASQITAHDGDFWLAGNAIKLRGVNVIPTWDGSSPTDADFARIASWGMNFVRLQVRWSFIEPTAPVWVGGDWVHTYSSTYISYLKNQIGWAYNHGLHVLVDNAGKPGPSDIDDWWPQWLYTPDYNSHRKLYLDPLEANTDYWTDSLQQRFTSDYLKYLSGQLASSPGIVGYEPLNEPAQGNLASTHEITQLILNVALSLARDVRVSDPSRVVFFMTRGCCGSGLPNADLSGFTTLGNVAFDVHDYNGGRWGEGLLMDPAAPDYGEVIQMMDRFTLSAGPYLGTTAAHVRVVQAFTRFLDPAGIPMVMGEFSGNPPSETNTATLMGTMSAAFNDQGVSWAVFAYDGRFGMVKADGTLEAWAQILIDAAKAP